MTFLCWYGTEHLTGAKASPNFDGWNLVPETSRKLFRESVTT